MIKRYGTEYGGFYLPSENEIELNEDSIIYSFGVGEDVTFDVIISRVSGAPVYLFDPTPRAISHVEDVNKYLTNLIKPIYNSKLGGGDSNYWDIIEKNQVSPDKLIMNNYGLYTENTTVKFYEPVNKEWVSHTILEGITSSDYIEVPVKNIVTIMAENKHTHIDLMKLDVEGIELDIIDNMIENDILPKYLCVDFDKARIDSDGRAKTEETLRKLESIGYSIANNINYDITLIKDFVIAKEVKPTIKGNNATDSSGTFTINKLS